MIEAAHTFLVDYLGALADYFTGSQSRVYLGYLLPTFVLAYAVLLVGARGKLSAAVSEGRRRVFGRSVWWSPSARADYKVFAVNTAIMMVFGSRLVAWTVVAAVLYSGLEALLGGRPDVIVLPYWLLLLIFSIVFYLIDDFSNYLIHLLLHRWPLLWAFHKVHHSAQALNPLTNYRTHPVEILVTGLRSMLAYATVYTAFLFFFGNALDVYTIMGINAAILVFNATGSNLRHMQVWFSYGRVMEKILISPAMHQIHHSVEERHHDRNYGLMLAIWDWMGGTLCVAKESGGDDIRYGLPAGPGSEKISLSALYLDPVLEAGRILRGAVTRGLQRQRG